jgi:hypothetical protein
MQNIVHQSHKSVRCISKTKRHKYTFIQTIFSLKSSFSFITFFFILIWWYSLFKSILVKTQKSCNSSNMSFNLGMECINFIVMLLIVLQSTHVLQYPSFFSTNNNRTKNGLMLSFMCPLDIFLICFWSFFVFSWLLI